MVNKRDSEIGKEKETCLEIGNDSQHYGKSEQIQNN